MESPRTDLELFKPSLRADLAPEAGLGNGEGARHGHVGPMKERGQRSDLRGKTQGSGTLDGGTSGEPSAVRTNQHPQLLHEHATRIEAVEICKHINKTVCARARLHTRAPGGRAFTRAPGARPPSPDGANGLTLKNQSALTLPGTVPARHYRSN